MEKTNFEKALDYTFANEGGFSNDSADRGGATRWGITREEASRWRRRPVSVAEMKNFPIAEAKAIYQGWYWLPLSLHLIDHPGIAIGMFDIGVVRGISVPPKYAQMICNEHGSNLVVDGHMGPKTIAAINAMCAGEFMIAFATLAQQGFQRIVDRTPAQGKFLKGWLARARRLRTLA